MESASSQVASSGGAVLVAATRAAARKKLRHSHTAERQNALVAALADRGRSLFDSSSSTDEGADDSGSATSERRGADGGGPPRHRRRPLYEKTYDPDTGAQQLAHAKQRIRDLAAALNHSSTELDIATLAMQQYRSLAQLIKEGLLKDVLLLAKGAGVDDVGRASFSAAVVTALDDERVMPLHTSICDLLRNDHVAAKDDRIKELETKELKQGRAIAEQQRLVAMAESEKASLSERVTTLLTDIARLKIAASSAEREKTRILEQCEAKLHTVVAKDQEISRLRDRMLERDGEFVELKERCDVLSEQFDQAVKEASAQRETSSAAMTGLMQAAKDLVRTQDAAVAQVRGSQGWAQQRAAMIDCGERLRQAGKSVSAVGQMADFTGLVAKVIFNEIATLKAAVASIAEGGQAAREREATTTAALAKVAAAVKQLASVQLPGSGPRDAASAKKTASKIATGQQPAAGPSGKAVTLPSERQGDMVASLESIVSVVTENIPEEPGTSVRTLLLNLVEIFRREELSWKAEMVDVAKLPSAPAAPSAPPQPPRATPAAEEASAGAKSTPAAPLELPSPLAAAAATLLAQLTQLGDRGHELEETAEEVYRRVSPQGHVVAAASLARPRLKEKLASCATLVKALRQGLVPFTTGVSVLGSGALTNVAGLLAPAVDAAAQLLLCLEREFHEHTLSAQDRASEQLLPLCQRLERHAVALDNWKHVATVGSPPGDTPQPPPAVVTAADQAAVTTAFHVARLNAQRTTKALVDDLAKAASDSHAGGAMALPTVWNTILAAMTSIVRSQSRVYDAAMTAWTCLGAPDPPVLESVDAATTSLHVRDARCYLTSASLGPAPPTLLVDAQTDLQNDRTLTGASDLWVRHVVAIRAVTAPWAMPQPPPPPSEAAVPIAADTTVVVPLLQTTLSSGGLLRRAASPTTGLASPRLGGSMRVRPPDVLKGSVHAATDAADHPPTALATSVENMPDDPPFGSEALTQSRRQPHGPPSPSVAPIDGFTLSFQQTNSPPNDHTPQVVASLRTSPTNDVVPGPPPPVTTVVPSKGGATSLVTPVAMKGSSHTAAGGKSKSGVAATTGRGGGGGTHRTVADVKIHPQIHAVLPLADIAVQCTLLSDASLQEGSTHRSASPKEAQRHESSQTDPPPRGDGFSTSTVKGLAPTTTTTAAVPVHFRARTKPEDRRPASAAPQGPTRVGRSEQHSASSKAATAPPPAPSELDTEQRKGRPEDDPSRRPTTPATAAAASPPEAPLCPPTAAMVPHPGVADGSTHQKGPHPLTFTSSTNRTTTTMARRPGTATVSSGVRSKLADAADRWSLSALPDSCAPVVLSHPSLTTTDAVVAGKVRIAAPDDLPSRTLRSVPRSAPAVRSEHVPDSTLTIDATGLRGGSPKRVLLHGDRHMAPDTSEVNQGGGPAPWPRPVGLSSHQLRPEFDAPQPPLGSAAPPVVPQRAVSPPRTAAARSYSPATLRPGEPSDDEGATAIASVVRLSRRGPPPLARRSRDVDAIHRYIVETDRQQHDAGLNPKSVARESEPVLNGADVPRTMAIMPRVSISSGIMRAIQDRARRHVGGPFGGPLDAERGTDPEGDRSFAAAGLHLSHPDVASVARAVCSPDSVIHLALSRGSDDTGTTGNDHRNPNSAPLGNRRPQTAIGIARQRRLDAEFAKVTAAAGGVLPGDDNDVKAVLDAAATMGFAYVPANDPLHPLMTQHRRRD